MNNSFFNEEDIRAIFEKEQDRPKPPKTEERLEIEFKPEPKPVPPPKPESRPVPESKVEPKAESTTKKQFWSEYERYQTAAKLHQDRLVIPKLILRFLGIFVLIFIISYTIINGPALILKMKYFWDNDYRNKSWGSDSQPAPGAASKNESRLIIPNIRVNAPIIWNIPEDKIIENLQNGVVQYQGTALPGQPGNVFITGHSSYYLWSAGSYKDIFALLDKLSAGDKIYIQYLGVLFTYRVTNQKVVDPEDLRVLVPTGENVLNLMTCVPIGTNLRRLIVTAEQIPS